MTATKLRPAAYADIEALPANMVGQIVHGVLYAHARPVPRHARAAGEVFGEIRSPFDRGRGGPGGWIILPEPELHLGPHVLVPDIAGWKRERLTPFPQGAYIETRNGFDVDGVEIKCRLDFGAKAIDWRGLYKNNGV